MRILHTSDWHIGRTFHGHSTVEALRTVLKALVDVVKNRTVDVVLVAGDVFDSATPAADYFDLLTEALRGIRKAGASVIVTSGNHDSAKRLGFQAEFAGLGGVHVITRVEQHDRPISIDDEHGPVHFYGIPYLEPALIRHLYPDETLRTHEQALGFAMSSIRADAADRGGRSVVLSHCFAAGVAASDEASDVERDITAGGLDVVPLPVFDGPDYVALGHIHGRSQLSDRVRYSGAPLHYSFAEAGKPRGAWLVELDATGLASVDWVDLPIPRRLSILTGPIDELLTDAAYAEFEQDWVSAILTDQARPIDAMRRLQERFPGCATLEHRPAIHLVTDTVTYAERVNAKSDHEIVGGFLELVRNGIGPTDAEQAVIGEVIAAERAQEATA
ncbi:exonuclease SbcCD subunit D [Diaminobutyricimonas sp. TR449]|uniref:exonuclease SbcCD subunit D n=1 Tax=Diaminobutyricimonas sp. TR449 TaxID=2708076 RepID=UPI001421211C|nr:exonuclease SbcCD subunit D [Diaminobutyricimonas sp. TR449]